MALSEPDRASDPTRRRTTAGARQRAHAVPRAGPDPVARARTSCTCRTSRTSSCSGSFLGVGLGFLVAGRSWSFLRWTPLLLALLVVVRPRVPGVGRPLRAATSSTSPPCTPPGRRPGWSLPVVFLLVAGDPGRSGRGRRPLLRRAPPADGVPLGPDRILVGIRLFTVLSLPAGTVRGLGRPRRGRLHGAGRRPVPGARRARRVVGRGRGAAAARRSRRASPGRRTTRSQTTRTARRTARGCSSRSTACPTRPMATAAVEAREGLQDLRRAVPAPRPDTPARRAGRRGRLRLGRRDRAAQGRPARGRGRHRPAARADRRAAATRTTPTRTLGSPGTSTTAARSCRTPTSATT